MKEPKKAKVWLHSWGTLDDGRDFDSFEAICSPKCFEKVIKDSKSDFYKVHHLEFVTFDEVPRDFLVDKFDFCHYCVDE